MHLHAKCAYSEHLGEQISMHLIMWKYDTLEKLSVIEYVVYIVYN